MLDLNQMALFVQVVQAGSFAEAARRLAMPPTTLSRQVAQLEDALQSRLLQRTTRKLTLTDAGRTLFDQCAEQIHALNNAASQLAGASQAPKGGIRVAAAAGFFEFFQMEWIAEFLRHYPGVQLEFVLADAMADFIGEGIDVAFRGSPELPDSSLVARKVASGHLVLAASPAYLSAHTPLRCASGLRFGPTPKARKEIGCEHLVHLLLDSRDGYGIRHRRHLAGTAVAARRYPTDRSATPGQPDYCQ